MKEILKQLLGKMSEEIQNDLKEGKIDVDMLVDVYNDWQEDERDGVDYLFHVCDKNDVITCLQGGMSVFEFVDIYKSTDKSPYFFFGTNHEKPELVKSESDLVDLLVNELPSMLPHVIARPYAHKSYKSLYDLYISDCCFDHLI